MTRARIFIFFTLLSLPFLAEAAFGRELYPGSTGADVKELQILLNRDPATRVSAAGPGSPGFETTSFGALTRAAVVKFQQKYAIELQLAVPTGRADPKTLNLLTRKSGTIGAAVPTTTTALGTPKAVVTTSKTSSPLPKVGSLEPDEVKMSKLTKITSISPKSGPPGTKVTIKGSGFSKTDNWVFTGFEWKKGVVSKNGTTLTVKMPDPFRTSKYRSDISAGGGTFKVPQGIYIYNQTGVSNAVIFNMTY